MNIQEIRTVLRAVASLCPAQKFDEFTPDMWLAVLADTAFDDAKTAVVTLGRQQPFIAPGEIHTEVRRIRTARIDRLPQPCPNDVPGVTQHAEQLAIRMAIADGRITTRGQLAAYERWGGSLHLVALGEAPFPALEGPEPVGTGPILAGRERTGGHPVALAAVTRQLPPR